MKNNYITLVVATLVIALYFFARVLDYEEVSYYAQLILAPIILGLYLYKNKKKSSLFVLFLACYTFANFLHFVSRGAESLTMFYVCNTLYIVAYIFLLGYIYRQTRINNVIKNFPIQLSVLALLSIYLMYKLVVIIDPVGFSGRDYILIQVMEGAYNVTLLLLLSASLLSLLDKVNRKTFFLFIGCLFLFLSEIIVIDSYYISGDFLPSVIAGGLYILAFSCFYYHAIVVVPKKQML
ncbi:MAG: hypothetical protein KBT58_00770 [Bizionia sp.]|nr:hypothetical protein [Bizionia sp.]